MTNLTAISIDDDPMWNLIIKTLCKRLDFVNLECSYTDPFKGAAGIVEINPDFVFIDVDMPGYTGLQIIETVYSRSKYIVLSSNPDFESKALALKASAFLRKPTTIEKLSAAVQKVREEIGTEV
ncbi:MAG: two-component system LytT family response regulator [Cyclobacteriaceae bacterium]|jgi:two-component system LytT family response regulator